jgi:hypothetical protein
MTEAIVSRQEIAADADAAAQRYVITGVEQDCPYVSGTEASREWRAAYQRYLLLHSSGEGVEASA